MIRTAIKFNAVLGLVFAIGCQSSSSSLELGSSTHQVDVTCSESSRNLLAGQHIDVGSVTVRQVAEYDDNTGDLVAQQVCVSFEIEVADWFITETHLAITDDPADLPQNRRGNPQVGRFPYKNEGLHATSHEHCIDYAAAGYAPGTSLYIASHAVVQREDAGAVVQEETAWGEGHDFGGRNWSMYFEHDLLECAPPEPPKPPAICGWRTQNRDDWGETACHLDSTNELGCMRDNLWATAIGIYPEQHFEIGCYNPATNKRTYRIDNKKVVHLHLGTRPAAGIGNDPARAVTHAESVQYWLSGYSGEVEIYTKFFGDIVGLHLNLEYDRAEGFRFHDTSHDLADLVVGDTASPCLGMTVAEVLEEANTLLGACSSDFTAEELSSCVNDINDAFRGGQDGNGDPLCSDYLTTPVP